MDAKMRDLTLLAALSLFCATFAWAEDRDVFGSVFFATTFHRIQGNCDHMLAECVILTEITIAASFIITMRGNEYVILMSAMHCCGITDFIGFEIRYFPVFVERKSAPPCWALNCSKPAASHP
jgi:hypothetical protein